MWMMLQQDKPQDFVVATGRSVSLEYFVDRTFARLGLAWRDHVRLDTSLLRPSDIRYGSADPSHASRLLGWRANRQVDDVIGAMCDAATAQLRTPVADR
jgi:GDPmannose 4,6-dehydratase